MQDCNRDLTVQLVILDQQDMPSAEVGVFPGQDVLRLRLRMSDGCQQGVAQVGQEHRLGAERRHARRLRLPFDIRPVVGSQDDNRGIVVQAANLARDLDAVHVRQPPVDDIGAAGVAQLDGLPCTQHSLPAGKRPLRTHSHTSQQLCHAVAGVEIVVHHQRLEAGKLRDLFLAAGSGLHAQRQADDKLGAPVLLGLHLDRAAHHLDNVPSDGHAEAGSLYPADRRGTLAFKRLEDLLRELRTHADAVVADAELVLCTVAHGSGKLPDTHGDRAARRRELDGVGQQVEQDLPHARPVAVNVLVGNVKRIHIKLELLGVHLSADDGLDVVQHLGQVDLGFLQLELAALDAAHIQNIVDEREQVATRGEGFGQIVLHPFLIVDIADRKGGKADDRIHRCANIVRHIGQEGALGAAGGFGGRNRLRKRLIDLPVSRAVGHHEDVLGPACDLAAHGDDVEPAALTGLLMGIIGVPFALLAALNPREEVLIVVGRILRVQRPQCTDVLLHLLERHAQQPLDVRADIVRAGGFGIQHEENIVHVA